jgi:DNA invertase Pin-like site-specific DNA recombinase
LCVDFHGERSDDAGVKKIGVSYLRFSTKEQKKGNSSERQRDIFTDWCSRNDLVPDLNASIADEGLSAFKGDHLKKNGALGVFRDAVMAGLFPNHVLVAENLDRISRQGPKLARKLIEQIVDNGVDIHICNINVKLTPGWENDPGRSIIVDVELGRAWNESNYKSERLSKAWGSKKAKAVNGLAITKNVPMWMDAKTGQAPVLNAQRAEIVQKIFRLAALGFGSYRIVGKLTTDGDKPFGINDRSGAKRWTIPYVKKILKNRAVLGEFQPKKRVAGVRKIDGVPVANFFPPVITHEEWDAARQGVEDRTHNYLNSKTGNMMAGWKGGRSSGDKDLFSGLIFDASLEGRRIGFRGKSGRAKVAYLYTAYQAGKPQHSMRYDLFEPLFLSFLEDLNWKAVGSYGESDEEKAASARLEEALAGVDRISQNVAAMEKLVEDGVFSKALFESLDAAKVKLVEAISRKEKLATEVASVRAKFSAIQSSDELLALIKSGNSELRLKLKSEIAKRVSRIDVEFENRKPVRAVIKLINGFTDFILFQSSK